MASRTDAALIEIVGPVDVGTVSPVHARILDALKNSKTVVLDLTQLGDADVTLVQLIEAARTYATANRKSLRIERPVPSELGRLLERGGFLGTSDRRAFWLGQEHT